MTGQARAGAVSQPRPFVVKDDYDKLATCIWLGLFEEEAVARVLVVEDDSDFAESLSIALGVRKCRVDVASTGQEAVRMYKKGDYDLVFMDIKLPGRSGVEVLQDIRSEHPEARIVIMTGFTEPALLNAALQAGAMDVLRKPFKMRQLFDYLDALPQEKD